MWAEAEDDGGLKEHTTVLSNVNRADTTKDIFKGRTAKMKTHAGAAKGNIYRKKTTIHFKHERRARLHIRSRVKTLKSALVLFC